MILSDFIENFLYRLLRGVCQNDIVLVIFWSFTPHAKVQGRNRPLYIYIYTHKPLAILFSISWNCFCFDFFRNQLMLLTISCISNFFKWILIFESCSCFILFYRISCCGYHVYFFGGLFLRIVYIWIVIFDIYIFFNIEIFPCIESIFTNIYWRMLHP